MATSTQLRTCYQKDFSPRSLLDLSDVLFFLVLPYLHLLECFLPNMVGSKPRSPPATLHANNLAQQVEATPSDQISTCGSLNHCSAQLKNLSPQPFPQSVTTCNSLNRNGSPLFSSVI